MPVSISLGHGTTSVFFDDNLLLACGGHAEMPLYEFTPNQVFERLPRLPQIRTEYKHLSEGPNAGLGNVVSWRCVYYSLSTHENCLV
jgi:hypothetical protein